VQIEDGTSFKLVTPYRGTCRDAARRIASLTALDGPSMRIKPRGGRRRLAQLTPRSQPGECILQIAPASPPSRMPALPGLSWRPRAGAVFDIDA
jgi:hypothetical protein